METSFAERQQQLVARMVEALVDARAQIASDRESLHGSVIREDGSVDDAEKPVLDEYDRVLEQINLALDLAKGER
jgi:ABC-type nitrate/sulfonate/bicarbonate transport system substrate-binding protein